MLSDIHFFLGPLPIGIPSHWLFASRSRFSLFMWVCWARHPPIIADHYDTLAVTGGLHPLLDTSPKNSQASRSKWLTKWGDICPSSPIEAYHEGAVSIILSVIQFSFQSATETSECQGQVLDSQKAASSKSKGRKWRSRVIHTAPADCVESSDRDVLKYLLLTINLKQKERSYADM